MTRSMRDNKIPAMAWPFNLAEFALLLVLYAKHNGLDTAEKLMRMVIEFCFEHSALLLSQFFKHVLNSIMQFYLFLKNFPFARFFTILITFPVKN